ncbi:hypothetical protein BDV12DRAFT_207201 [Aspergillus spectabilis]
MKSSTNTDGRRIVSDAIHLTTGKSLHDTVPTLNGVNSETSESPPILLHQGQHIRTEEEARKNVQDLKVRLNCERAKCGSRTKTTGKPCEVPLNKHKITAADARFESLTLLTQSSANLGDELLKLANIVHCRQHADEASVQHRVRDWTMLFPTGDGKVIPVISVAKQIRDILLNGASNHCLGKTKKGSRCRLRIGGQKVQNYRKTINEIVKPDTYLDDSELDFFLQVLRHNSFCFYHLCAQGAEQVKTWRLIITNLRSEDVSPSADSDISPTSKENSQLANSTSLYMDTSSSNIVRHRSKSLSPDRFWPEKYDNSAFEIVTQSIDTDDYGLSLSRIQLTPPAILKEEHRTKGYVYAYEVEGNKGLVKIGYTTKTVEERHSEWTFECNRLVLPIYPIHPQSAVAVPNAAWVEALCHAELKHCSVRIYCTACLRQHVEWFRVSSAEAIALIRKWSNWMWMKSLPYQSSLDLASDTWPLAKKKGGHAIDVNQAVDGIPVRPQAIQEKSGGPATLKQ